MTDPMIHPHRPIGSDTWCIIQDRPSSHGQPIKVLLSGLSNDAAWAHVLIRYYEQDPDVMRAALERLVELADGWKADVARRVLQTLEDEE